MPPEELTLTEQPRRIQRMRTKGWKMPPNTVYVGRPSKWGNPIKVGPEDHEASTAYQAKQIFASQIGGLQRIRIKSELRGKNLACWCPIWQACHADVLLEIANS